MDPEDDIWNLLDSLTVKKETITDRKCPNCNSTDFIEDDGHEICKNCSSMVLRMLDSSAEWRYYGGEDGGDPARCGMPTNVLLPKSSLGSMIGNGGGARDTRRMRMYQMWNSMPYSERTLYHVFDHIISNAAKFNITNKIIDDAKMLYKQASEKRISRGVKKEGLIASCIYHACLLNKVPRSPKEVARMFNIDTIVLTKGNSVFQNLMQINVDSCGPEDFIARFGSKLNMNYDDIQRCKVLARRLDELEVVSENAPTSVAAGTLYYYSLKQSIDLNKKSIADACEVSEVTITKCLKRLNKQRELIDRTFAELI